VTYLSTFLFRSLRSTKHDYINGVFYFRCYFSAILLFQWVYVHRVYHWYLYFTNFVTCFCTAQRTSINRFHHNYFILQIFIISRFLQMIDLHFVFVAVFYFFILFYLYSCVFYTVIAFRFVYSFEDSVSFSL